MARLRLSAVLTAATGGEALLNAPGRTVGEVLAEAVARHPALGPRLRDANGEPYPYVLFYVDQEDIRFARGFATPVSENSEIVVVPAIAGG
jgi:molybdopterin synthase sulfur carrier subunit